MFCPPETFVPLRRIRLEGSSTGATASDLDVDTRVSANWSNRGRYYEGKISKVNQPTAEAESDADGDNKEEGQGGGADASTANTSDNDNDNDDSSAANANANANAKGGECCKKEDGAGDTK